MPVIGSLVRALDSLPAYRQQDAGEDVTRNRETFEAAWKLLSRGGTIGICPEGVSHNEPRLKPLRPAQHGSPWAQRPAVVNSM